MMKMNVQRQPRCPVCQSTDVVSVGSQREFHPHGRRVAVDLLASRCRACGTEFTRSAQHDENLRRLKARKDQYDGLLLGEEIFALRRRYGITQRAAAKLFGKGKIAFSRYENETSYPDESTTRLLQLAIEKPDVIRWLADRTNVDLPLWDARCADERGQKLHMISVVRKVSTHDSAWVRGRQPTGDPVALRAWERGGFSGSDLEIAMNDEAYEVRERYT